MSTVQREAAAWLFSVWSGTSFSGREMRPQAPPLVALSIRLEAAHLSRQLDPEWYEVATRMEWQRGKEENRRRQVASLRPQDVRALMDMTHQDALSYLNTHPLVFT